MTLTGDVTLNSGSSWVEVSATANDVFSFGGNFTNNATTFTGTSTGTHTFSGTAKTISGSTTTSIPSVTFSGTYTNSGILTVATALAQSGTGALTNGNGTSGTLNINFTGTPGIGATHLTATATGDTVNYGYAGTQTLLGITYYNLTLSGTSAKTMTGVTTVNGNLTMSGTATTTGCVITTVGGNVALSGTANTLTAGAAMTISGGVTIASGCTFVAGSYTHNVAGNWANSGAFTNTGSTINFNGTSLQTISGTTTFNNLTISNTSASVSAGTNITVSATLTVNANATLDMAGNTLTLGTTTTNNGTVRFSGTTNGKPVGTTGTVEYYGPNQTVTSGTYHNLTINQSSGAASLGGAVTVGGILTLKSGILATTSSYYVAITNTSSSAVTGYSSSSYVNGSLQWSLASGSSYLFPVGDASNYRPFEMNSIVCSSPVVRVTMSSTGASTVDGTTLSSIGARNWFAQLIGGSFTSATIRITETGLVSTDAIGESSAQSGPYASIGGNSIGSTITSNTGVSYTTSEYFAIGIVAPAVVLSDNGAQVTGASVAGGTANVVLHKSELAVTLVNATLTGMTCTTAGTYAAADISNLKVWYQTTSTFNAGTATLLSTLTTVGTAGAKTFTSFTSQLISSGTTGYIYITTDVAAGATPGNTINLSALTTSNFTFTSAAKSGSTTAGGSQTFTTAVYYNASSGAGALQTLSNWGTNADGSGTTPGSFIANYQVFVIRNNTSAAISGTWTVSGTNSKVVLGNPSVAAITFTVPSSYPFTGTIDVAAALSGSNTLILQNGTLPTLGSLDATSTVVYGYQGASQSVTAATYGNLTISGLAGTTTFTLAGIATVAGNLSITSGTFDLGTYTANRSAAGGTLTVSSGATLDIGGINTFPTSYSSHSLDAASTVDYYGTAQTVTAETYGNLKLSGSGVKTMPGSTATVAANFTTAGTISAAAGAAINVGGTVTIGSGTTYNAGSYTHNVGGSWSNTGTFTCGTCTITFNSTSAGNTIAGTLTGATGKFYNITFNGAGGAWSFSNDAYVANNFTITNGSVSAPSSLTVAGNWSDGGTFTPGSGTVTFSGSPTQHISGPTGTQTFNNVVINNANNVIVDSSITIVGTLTIGNAASLELRAKPVLTIGSAASVTTTGTGKIILDTNASYINVSSSSPMLQVQTRITGSKGWRMLAAPDSVTVGSMFASPFVTQGFSGSTIDTLQPNLLWWDETSQGTSLQAWRQPSASSDMVKLGRGYMFYVFDGAGIVNSSSNYSDALPLTMSALGSEHPLTTAFDFGATATTRSPGSPDTTQPYVDTSYADYGWNLVGNPTPSTIDWNASSGWTKTNMDASIYIWDSDDSTYETWNGTTGNLGSGLIAPFQAFWVKANANSPSLQCTNGVKTTGGSFLGNIAKGPSPGSFPKKMADDSPGGSSLKKTTKISTSSTPVLSLNLSANGLQTQAYLMFSDQGKLTYDPYDAFSLVPLSTNYLILYSVAGDGQPAMQIQDLPDTGFGDPFTLPLYVGGTVGGQPLNGSFTLSWKLDGQLPTGWKITLMDDAAQKADSMTGTGELTFQYDTPAELVPSNGTLLEKNSGTVSNRRSLPWPVVQTVPTSRLSKTASVTPRFRLVISANKDLGYLPSTPELQQNYPNPFNPSTNIGFSVPAPSRVTIEVFNVLGQKVATVTDQNYATGKYVVTWNPRQVATGVYFCRMIVGNHKQTIKMVLLR
jgi:hypothetical protein